MLSNVIFIEVVVAIVVMLMVFFAGLLTGTIFNIVRMEDAWYGQNENNQ